MDIIAIQRKGHYSSTEIEAIKAAIAHNLHASEALKRYPVLAGRGQDAVRQKMEEVRKKENIPPNVSTPLKRGGILLLL